MTIPLNPIREIFRENGADRVSPEAVELVRNYIEGYVSGIAKDAIEISKYAGRKTVQAKDVEFIL